MSTASHHTIISRIMGEAQTPDQIRQAAANAYGMLRSGQMSAAEALPICALDPTYACLFAARVLHRPFPEGEPAIATSADASYDYAKNVLFYRFKKGEPAILKDGKAKRAHCYAKNIIHGPWPEAEDIIAKDPFWACHYATGVLHSRFKAAEPYIMADPEMAKRYADRYPDAKREWLAMGLVNVL